MPKNKGEFMSLEIDLSKLGKLVDKFREGTFDLGDYRNFLRLTESILKEKALFRKARARSNQIRRFIDALNQMKTYAEKYQMPKDTYYLGPNQLFRLCILDFDDKKRGANAIFLVSVSIFGNEKIEPGVYHWQHPQAYGHDEPDVIKRLSLGHIESLGLSNEQMTKIIEKADAIVRNNDISPVSPEDEVKKYR